MIDHGSKCNGNPCNCWDVKHDVNIQSINALHGKTCECQDCLDKLCGSDVPVICGCTEAEVQAGCKIQRLLVPSGDVAEAFQLAINRAIHDAWQEGYQQGLRDSFPPPDTEDKEAEALERRLKDDPLHKLYLASREAGIQHDGDFPDHCPLYCTKHNHEEMGG